MRSAVIEAVTAAARKPSIRKKKENKKVLYKS
mgnify:CR=1 FL=1